MVVMPLLVGGWLFVESPRKAYDELAEHLADMHNEVFIFGCSALFGALLNQRVSLDQLAPLLGGSSQVFWLQCIALLGIVWLSLIDIAPIITLSICAGLLAQLQAVGIHPLGLAVSLICTFSLTMLLSPSGPVALILARTAGTSPRTVVLTWNGRFALIVIPVLLALSWVAQWPP
ncbi:hypothetical protein [Pseudomonas veronii]|uniref:hypothetical protein n=1 Tax=Pseudomonas veronii TaxID=76761 RepID=UPI0021C15360|nr:hypothetical protein [Pseudomonas veronii]MCT9826646.1 hypothetical protein [Pseudomonas veronii]